MEKVLKDYAIRIEETVGKTVIVEGCPSLEDAITFVKQKVEDSHIELDIEDDYLDTNVFPSNHFENGEVNGQDVSWYESIEYADKEHSYLLVCFKNDELLYKLKTETKGEAVAHMQKAAIETVTKNANKKQSVIINNNESVVSIDSDLVTYRWIVSNIYEG